MDGEPAKYGFYAIQNIVADDQVAAEYAAAQQLREDQDLRAMVKNDVTDPPLMNVTEIVEVEEFDVEKYGKIWFSIHPKRWWQFWKR
jgi:hypothetical protein